MMTLAFIYLLTAQLVVGGKKQKKSNTATNTARNILTINGNGSLIEVYDNYNTTCSNDKNTKEYSMFQCSPNYQCIIPPPSSPYYIPGSAKTRCIMKPELRAVWKSECTASSETCLPGSFCYEHRCEACGTEGVICDPKKQYYNGSSSSCCPKLECVTILAYDGSAKSGNSTKSVCLSSSTFVKRAVSVRACYNTCPTTGIPRH